MNKNHGFTLIEILLVVAIIGVLSGIGFVILKDQQIKAASSACKSNITTISNSVILYNFKIGQMPESLAELTPDYLKSIPSCPLGQEYVYNPDSGEVVRHTH